MTKEYFSLIYLRHPGCCKQIICMLIVRIKKVIKNDERKIFLTGMWVI